MKSENLELLSSNFFPAAILLGALIRAAALPLPGTRDVGVWKLWAYNAATRGATQLYGVGGSPPERRMLEFHGAETTVDYPPLALYELGVVGGIYRAASGGRFPDTPALTATIKASLVLAEAGFVLLAFLAVRRAAGVAAARWAAITYWLNPAPILDASALGYLDPLFVLPAAGAIVAATAGWPALAGGLTAAAVLTKAQAVVIIPAVALAVWNAGQRPTAPTRTAAAIGSAAVASAVVLAPIVTAGAWPNMIGALESLTRHDMLSGTACNVWWIVGYVLRAIYSMDDVGVWAAFTAPTKILQISRVVELGYPNPRVVGTVLALAGMGWGVWTARRARDLWLVSAAGAFLVHAFATLSAQVHENHLFAAVPLLVIAAAGRRRYVPLLVALSAIFTLNLNLFYGISEYVGYAIPRTLTIIDLSVVLASANCVALAWHATVLRSECSTADAPRRSPVPA